MVVKNAHEFGGFVLRDLLTEIVDYGQSKGADFLEVRYESSDETVFHMEDGRVESVKQGIESGFAIRVLAMYPLAGMSGNTLDHSDCELALASLQVLGPFDIFQADHWLIPTSP